MGVSFCPCKRKKYLIDFTQATRSDTYHYLFPGNNITPDSNITQSKICNYLSHDDHKRIFFFIKNVIEYNSYIIKGIENRKFLYYIIEDELFYHEGYFCLDEKFEFDIRKIILNQKKNYFLHPILFNLLYQGKSITEVEKDNKYVLWSLAYILLKYFFYVEEYRLIEFHKECSKSNSVTLNIENYFKTWVNVQQLEFLKKLLFSRPETELEVLEIINQNIK
jgi:hypothetical protein